MSQSPYPTYKDSGVEWLGRVPAHWEVLPLKAMATCNDEVLPETTDSERVIEYVEISGVEEGRGITQTETLRFGAAPSRARRVVRTGDVLISTVRTYLRAIATVADAPENLIASTGFAAIRPRRVSPGYLGYLLHCEYLIAAVISRSVGISYPAINSSDLMCLKGPMPSINEQMAITAFLDRETAKIDALIDEQKHLIELLDEELKCLVLSSRAAKGTKEIRLGNAADVMARPVIQKEGEAYRPLGMYNRGRGIFHKDLREMADMGDSDFFWVMLGDLVISGQFAWEGAVGLASEEEDGCVVSHRYPVLRAKDAVALTEYLFVLLLTKHGDFVLNESSLGAAGRNRPLNLGLLLKERVWVPSMETQTRIARALHQSKRLTSEIEIQRDLLLERRAALISAAVTGKIDVRSLALQPEAVAA